MGSSLHFDLSTNARKISACTPKPGPVNRDNSPP